MLTQRYHVGGLQLLGQPVFLLLVAGHLIVAAAVLNGLRRTALAALVIAAAAYVTHWTAFVSPQRPDTLGNLTTAVFLLEAIALAVADPRAARRREGWQHVLPALVLAFAAQAWALAFDVRGRNQPLVDTFMVAMLVLIAFGVLLPLPLGLGWRTSLLLAAACESFVFAGAVQVPLNSSISQLARVGTGPGPTTAGDAAMLVTTFMPLLLVLSWAVAQAARARRTRDRGDLAA